MRYEHLIEINDPFFPLISPLTRRQLWQGLVRRACAPHEFIYGLDRADVHEVPSDDDGTRVLGRTLDYGSFVVHDVVRLRADESVCTDVEPGAAWPRSRMVITIEEPQENRLFLRFVYEWEETAAESELDHMSLQIRQQAYHAADLDTVARLREMAENHRL